MNASSEPKSIEQLLREGVQAARSGNKSVARDRLREVVKRDEQNEKGWIWLASVIDDPNEKRLCLSNVLVINPNNATAKRELAALEQAVSEASQEDQPRKRSRLPLLLLLAMLVIVLAGGLFITRQPSPPTPASPTPSQSGAQVADNATENSTAGAAAGTITVTPSITNTPTATWTPLAGTQSVVLATLPPVTLPATWTPAASVTSALGTTGTPLSPPPAGLTGHLVVLSGHILTPDGFLPIQIMSPDGSNAQMIVQDPDRGENALLLPDGHLLYTYITSGTSSVIMRIINRNASQPRDVSGGWGNFPPLADQHAGSLSANGQFLTFSAHNVIQNELYSAIYVLNIKPFLNGTVGAEPTGGAVTATPLPVRPGKPTLTPAPPTATLSIADLYLVRVTPKNIGDNSWPAISADGKNVAFVTDTTNVGGSGIDLYSAPVKPDSTPHQLTPDGDKLYKSAPAWSPDGKFIAFTSTPPDNSFSDIEIIEASGANCRVLAHLDKTHNFRPHWSPDGKYLAFTSDRTGKDEVFILDVSNNTLYQVTHDENTNIATDWSRQ